MSFLPPYPVTLDIDYIDKSSRLTVFFRFLLTLPVLFMLNLIVFLNIFMHMAVVLTILFRKRYPRWWFDWNVNLLKFITRVVAYLHFMTDSYPSLDEEQSVHLSVEYPESIYLSRFMPLIKPILVLPHLIILFLFSYAVLLLWPISWIIIVISGHYPRSLFNFNLGIFRWNTRVLAYSTFLFTDRYPPFSFN